MRPGKRMRAVAAAALAAGALAVGGAHGAHGDAQGARNWSQEQATAYKKAPLGHPTVRAPEPPSKIVLIDTSARGAALGFEIGVAAKHLGGAVDEGSAQHKGKILELVHKTVCFVVFWLLRKGIDPGGPRELALTIDPYLAVGGIPRLAYRRAKGDLVKISLAITEAQDSGRIARDVAEAACEEA